MSPAGPSMTHPRATKCCENKCVWKLNITPGDEEELWLHPSNFPSKSNLFCMGMRWPSLGPYSNPISATAIWASHLSPVPSHQLHVNANHRVNKHVFQILGFYLVAKMSYKSVSASVFFLMANNVLT